MAGYNVQLIRMVNQNLYSLKRQYGGRVVLCSLIDTDTDHTTGIKSVDYQITHIRRAIILPSRMMRDVVASVARITSNKQLAYGGEFHAGDRGFILHGKDVPSGVMIRADDWIVYRGERYSITKVLNVCGNTGWMINARKHQGTPLTFHVTGNTAINLNDGGGYD